jgi:hypothetical protein
MGILPVFSDLSSKSRALMMGRREAIQDALYLWRQAERELAAETDGRRPQLEADVVRHRNEYQRLYTANMLDNLDRLHDAEGRRARAIPSTPEFHDATRDTQAAAADIWHEARRGDLDTPQRGDRLPVQVKPQANRPS